MSHRSRLGTTLSGVLAAALPLVAFGCDDPDTTGAGERIGTAEQHLTQCVTFQRGTLGTVADGVIKSNDLTTNFGSQTTLNTSSKQEVLIQVDLGSIPSYAVVESATLKLFINATGNGNGTGIVSGNGNGYGLGNGNGNNTASAAINLHRALASWSESTVTYTSFNQQFEGTTVASIQPSSPGSQKSADLTSLVQAWVNGSKANHGVLLETTDSKQTIFVSSEGAQLYRPALEVCYSVPDEHCVPNPCENGGTCLNDWTGYTCECTPGYTGTNCEIDIDDCAAAPCLNGGACTDGVNSYSCECAPGFTGANCETNINECAPNPCQNGGVCTDGINAYTCACPPGYTGASCDIDIDECAADPCQNGQCADAVNGYSCTCYDGFTGANCETNIDDCAAHLCENEASCVDGITDYTCACLPGFTGEYCEINIDECAPENPCLHDGTCADGVNWYTCQCTAGYAGDNCEVDIDDCAAAPCQNEGICVDGVNSYTCECPVGWTGTNCDEVDHCAGDPCHVTTFQPDYEIQTGLSCTNTTEGFTCECRPLFGGATCDTMCPCVSEAIPIGDLDSALPWYYGAFGVPAVACATPYEGITLVSLGEGEMWFGASPVACAGNSNYTSFNPPNFIYSDPDQAQACQGIIDFAIANAGITCSESLPCDANPCQNGGECVNYGATPYCACPPGYLGDDCSIAGPCVASPTCGSTETCTSPDETSQTCSNQILVGDYVGGYNGGACDPPVATGAKTILRSGAGEAVWLSSDALGTSPPSFDDLAVVTVTSPSNAVAKLNVFNWGLECADPNAPTVNSGATGALDITSLFGSETGTFTVQVDVRNGGNGYYSWQDTYVGISR